MELTPHQAKLFIYELTHLTASGDPEKLVSTLMSTMVGKQLLFIIKWRVL